ncbi:hypothetical protein EYR40_007701 [Pleurotus pulmonarius]|nr:hypothetical protein EYR38_007996 [Pleurotus pulmonarius]KAF4597249.1 hypothetical protein EYR40_007701 [Pleurotus pulmonarius]
MMLPVANLHLKDLYDTTVEFFALRSPSFLFAGPSATPTHDSENCRALTPVPDPIARLTRECSSLRERLDAAESRQQHSTCTCQFSQQSPLQPLMRRQLDLTKNELSTSKIEVLRLEERCRMLERLLRETKDMLKARDTEIEKLKREREQQRTLDHRHRSDASLRYQFRSQSQRDKEESLSPPNSISPRPDSTLLAIYGHNHSLASFRNGHRRDGSGTSSIISIASSEEERAQARAFELFLTRTDAWSGAQILQAVHDLNSEILQFAASATETCSFERDVHHLAGKNSQAIQDTAARLGPQITRILSTRDHSQDPILVQLALQGCVVACISRALSSFCIGWPSKADSVILQVYAYMYATEPQPTSSRWRSLTHKHIHKLYPTLEDYGNNDLVETILRWISDVLTAAGCTPSLSTSHSSPSSSPHISQSLPHSNSLSQLQLNQTSFTKEALRVRFGDQVRRIAKSVTKLAQVTREEVMSTNFDLVAVGYTDTFDSHLMQDSFADYSTSRGSVLLTSEFGLRCTTKKGGVAGMSVVADGKTDDGIERRLLLRPRIVLESVLDVLDPK